MGLKDIFNISKILKENHRLKNLIATLTAKITEIEEKYQKLQEDYSQLEQNNTFSQINTINNINESSVDELLNRFDKLSKHNKSYDELITDLKPYKKSNKKEELILVLKNKIASKETFLKLEQTTWTVLFVILGLFTTVVSDLIIANHAELESFNNISKEAYISTTIFFIILETLLYCWASLTTIRKKNKKLSFYKLVYNYLNQKEAD